MTTITTTILIVVITMITSIIRTINAMVDDLQQRNIAGAACCVNASNTQDSPKPKAPKPETYRDHGIRALGFPGDFRL